MASRFRQAVRPANLAKWLARAVQRGLMAFEGSGRKADPYRYWLPAREAVWKADPLYEFLEEQRQALKLTFRSLNEKKRVDRENWRLEVPRTRPTKDDGLPPVRKHH
jgi:hypothetical protein